MRTKEILIWLTIFIVGSLIVNFLISPNLASNFVDSIKSNAKISVTSSEDFPCISSLKEYIKIEEMKGRSLSLIENQIFTDKQVLKDYFTKYGGGGKVIISQQMVDEMIMPVEIVLIKVKKCIGNECRTWFEWGTCNNNEYSKRYELV